MKQLGSVQMKRNDVPTAMENRLGTNAHLPMYLSSSHEQNSTYSVFMHVCEAWQPLLSLQIYSNNQLQMV